MIKFLLCAVLCSCVFPQGLTPVTSQNVSLEIWTRGVQAAVDSWQKVLPCDLDLDLNPDGIPVRLVPAEHWPESPQYGGMYYGDEIKIRENLPDRESIIAHEIGHIYFGAEHSSNPRSIRFWLVYPNQRPTWQDGYELTQILCDR